MNDENADPNVPTHAPRDKAAMQQQQQTSRRADRLNEARSMSLRQEHERATALLEREKTVAASIAHAAMEKGRKVEAALQVIASAQEDLDRQTQELHLKVSP